MKTNRKKIGTQRQLMDKKLLPWLSLRSENSPPSGWLKAVRGALGLTSRQLADIVGIDNSAILRLEDREPEGKVSLELLNKVAKGMNCKVIYAIVPEDKYQSLESIVDEKAKKMAVELIDRVEHSMLLEEQGSPDSKKEV